MGVDDKQYFVLPSSIFFSSTFASGLLSVIVCPTFWAAISGKVVLNGD